MNNTGKQIVLVSQPNLDGNFKNDAIEDSPNEKIFLDYNGTTPFATEVIQAITEAMKESWSNPSSRYKEGLNAKKKIEKSRQLLANMINADSSSDLVFVSGGTEANNIVFHSVLKSYESCKKKAQYKNLEINKLPHIIVSEIEHDSVKLVVENYEKEKLAEISVIEVDKHGAVNVDSVIDAIKPNTILISIMLANNETGVLQPIKKLTDKLNRYTYDDNNNGNRQCPLFVHTDAAQAFGKIKVDVNELQVDYLTIVGHKFYGPRIGCLYARNCKNNFEYNNDIEVNQQIRIAPIKHLFYGAGQESGLRPGTENTPMIIGLGKAAELVINNLEKYSSHLKEIRDYLEKRLEDEFGIENLHFNGRSKNSERLPNTCNVSFIGSDLYKGWVILENTKLLEASTGACCHAGLLEPSKILLTMKIERNIASNALRLSVGRETTKSEIDKIIQDIKESLEKIKNSHNYRS